MAKYFLKKSTVKIKKSYYDKKNKNTNYNNNTLLPQHSL